MSINPVYPYFGRGQSRGDPALDRAVSEIQQWGMRIAKEYAEAINASASVYEADDYTPGTTAIVLGTGGSITGSYVYIGSATEGLLHIEFSLILGTGGDVTAEPAIWLPQLSSPRSYEMIINNDKRHFGVCAFQDTSVSTNIKFIGSFRWRGAQNVAMMPHTANATYQTSNQTTATTPMNWENTDRADGVFTVRVTRT